MSKRNKGNKYKYMAIIMFAVSFLCVLIFCYTYIYPYQSFYLCSSPSFQVVDFSTNFVPQGIEYIEKDKTYIISGYEYPDGYSKIVVVDKNNKKYEKSIVNSNGQKFKWHSGGIACHGNYVYVTGGNRKCYVLLKDDLLDSTKEEITISGTFKTDSNSSFCFVYGNCLFIGEYQYQTKFVTDENHHLKSPRGNFNTAMVFAYPFSKDTKYGLSTHPIMALSIGSSIQGMCMDKQGYMYLSASSKFNESTLYVYDFSKVVQTVDSFVVQNNEVIPVFIFEDDAMITKKRVPPNAEGVTAYKDSVYIVFESASKRFKYGWLFGTQFVYKINTKRFIG